MINEDYSPQKFPSIFDPKKNLAQLVPLFDLPHIYVFIIDGEMLKHVRIYLLARILHNAAGRAYYL